MPVTDVTKIAPRSFGPMPALCNALHRRFFARVPARARSRRCWPVPKWSDLRRNRSVRQDNGPRPACFHRGDRECPDSTTDDANRSSAPPSIPPACSSTLEKRSRRLQSSSIGLLVWWLNWFRRIVSREWAISTMCFCKKLRKRLTAAFRAGGTLGAFSAGNDGQKRNLRAEVTNFPRIADARGEKNPRVWGRRPGDGGEGRWAENFLKSCRA